MGNKTSRASYNDLLVEDGPPPYESKTSLIVEEWRSSSTIGQERNLNVLTQAVVKMLSSQAIKGHSIVTFVVCDGTHTCETFTLDKVKVPCIYTGAIPNMFEVKTIDTLLDELACRFKQQTGANLQVIYRNGVSTHSTPFIVFRVSFE